MINERISWMDDFTRGFLRAEVGMSFLAGTDIYLHNKMVLQQRRSTELDYCGLGG